MPHVSISICEKCGNSFIIDLDNCKVFPGMHMRIRKQGEEPHPIDTWADWIDHISTYCPECRFPQPPTHAIEDRDELARRRRKS